MSVLWIALAFVVGAAAATRAQQDQLAAAYRAGLGGSR